MSTMPPPQRQPPPNATVSVSYLNGKLEVPSSMQVKRGARVAWRVRSDRRLRWTVYFDHGTPFDATTGEVVAESADVVLGTADEPGGYKYGVRVTDPQSDAVLGDDDPYLIVTP
jgi:hypothetical protein